MDKFLDLAVVLLPTLFSVVCVLVPLERLIQKHKWKLRAGLLVFGVVISVLTYVQQQRQIDQSNRQIATSLESQSRAETQQRLTQEKLDESLIKLNESLQRQQRSVDLMHDLQTTLQAQDELLQIVKASLNPELREKADNIHKHYVREVYESIQTTVGVSATVGKAGGEPPTQPKP